MEQGMSGGKYKHINNYGWKICIFGKINLTQGWKNRREGDVA
jgi:hypothetical protein